MTHHQTTKRTPSLTAYFVPEREGAAWTKIGAAWAHNDGKGYTLDLELIPTGSGRITLRPFEAKQKEAGA